MENFTQPSTYRSDVSYGIRKWDDAKGKWLYCGDAFSYDVWVESESLCRSTTSLLSAMFTAQQKAHETKEVVYVVMFEDPKTVWSTFHTNRNLTLEDNKK